MVHEHLTSDSLGESIDGVIREERVALAISNLRDYHGVGGGAIVDVTPIGMGRDVHVLRRITRESGVHVVCCTGFYFGSFIPYYVEKMDIDQIASKFIQELMQGINGTSVRAGVIGEVGTSHGQITGLEEKVLRAAGRAHLATGAPIYTHTTYGTMANEQLNILEKEGVDLHKVILGHCDVFHPLEQLVTVAARGAYVAFDTVGKEVWRSWDGRHYQQPDERRVELIVEMIRLGFAGQLLLSSDILVGREEMSLNPKSLGAFGYSYILKGFVPRLRRAGIEDRVINQILTENPARVLRPNR